MANDYTIRSACSEDAASLLEIYRPFVENTVVSFELETPSLREFSQRVVSVLESHVWMVAESKDGLLGYAYGSTHRPRKAYQFSVETSVYVLPDRQGIGVGKCLYERLLLALADGGFENAYAGIALPNDRSIQFHQRQGFIPVGVFPRVGRKFDQWHDVAWMHRSL